MLHRFLFVAGMTVGVMTPLVWMAYVARPAPHEARASAVATAVDPGAREQAPVAIQRTATKKVRTKLTTTADVTASIPPASMKLPTAKPTSLVTQTRPTALPQPVRHAKLTPPHFKRTNLTEPRRMAHRSEDRAIPAVVNRYNGAHIIIVCAALTMNEQLRDGCP